MFKRSITPLLLAIVCWLISGNFMSVQAAGQNSIGIEINGQLISQSTNNNALLVNGRVYVPIRFISENLGDTVDWRQDTRQILINTAADAVPVRSDDGRDLQIVVQGKTMNVAGDYGTPFLTTAGVTMIPLRAVGEMLGCNVDWQNDQQLVEVNATLPDGGQQAAANISILGPSQVSADQIRKWINAETPMVQAKMARLGRPFSPIPDLADLYISIGAAYGVRGDLAFFQMIKETDFMQFDGEVQPSQNNYCGLWAVGTPNSGNEVLNGADPNFVKMENGLYGASFTSPAAGIEAQIQHLYAYATTAALPAGKDLYDPRFKLVRRGAAPTWVKLDGLWAVPGNNYGESIIDYWTSAMHQS